MEICMSRNQTLAWRLDAPLVVLGEAIPGKQSPQGPLHVAVPQGVDKWVEHWSSQCVHQWDELILLGVVAGAGAQVHEGTAAVLQQDHRQVGGAGGEGPVTPSCWVDLEHGSHNEDIGGGNEEERDGNGQCGCHEHWQLMDVAVGTNKPHHWWGITKEVLDSASPAEWQREDEGRQLYGQEQANDHRGHDQTATES